MAGAAPSFNIGQGFGTWLIPIIIFGILFSVVIVSLVFLACSRSCWRNRRITKEPEATHETYHTPTTTYRDPPSDGFVGPTVGRPIRHSRSLHVPRSQATNGYCLRPQVSSPDLRNTSQPPPYTYQTMPFPPSRPNPRPYGQVFFDQIVDHGRSPLVPYRSQRPAPSTENLVIRPERCLSASSPSSYSSSCMSMEGPVSAEAFSPPSTPSIFSQESLTPSQPSSWVNFPEAQDSDSDSGSFPTPSSHNQFIVVSALPDPYETNKSATARPRNRSESGGRTGRSTQNNRRLIIVDDNLVSGDSEMPSGGFEVHALRKPDVTRLVTTGTPERRMAACLTNVRITANETKKAKEAEIEKLSGAGRDAAVFKVMCPDTNDLWKMPVIPGETLDGFASRVKRKTGGDVILFAGGGILANEEDWKAANGGGRIVAHLIR